MAIDPASLALPSEIMGLVLSHLVPPLRSVQRRDEDSRWRADLRSAALVRRSYTAVAQRWLLDSITLSTVEQIAAIEEAMDAGLLNAALVRVLTINPIFDAEAWQRDTYSGDFAGGTGDPWGFEAAKMEARRETFEAVEAAASRLARRCGALEAIRTRATHGRGALRSGSDWPAVELLFDDVADSASGTVALALNLHGSQFSALTLWCSPGYGPLDPVLGYVETAALHRLVRLQLGSREQPYDLRGPIVTIPSPSLRHLALFLEKWREGAELALAAPVYGTWPATVDNPPAFPQLRSLTLGMGFSAGTFASCSLIHRLPSSLRSLHVDLSSPTDEQAFRYPANRRGIRIECAEFFELMATEILYKLDEDVGELKQITVVPMPFSAYCKLDADRQSLDSADWSWIGRRDAAVARLEEGCQERDIELRLS